MIDGEVFRFSIRRPVVRYGKLSFPAFIIIQAVSIARWTEKYNPPRFSYGRGNLTRYINLVIGGIQVRIFLSGRYKWPS